MMQKPSDPVPAVAVNGPEWQSSRLGRAVALEHVSKRYDDFVAVDDLVLEIGAGELVTLLGPSGSGKTTTLMMVAGFTDPSCGEIRIGERLVTHVPTHHRDLGVVFQQYALFPHMTVAENVAFPLRMRGIGRAEREDRVARALDLVEMSRFAPRFPSELSGGQQQRVAFARAVVFDPPVLLLDEPLGALDKKLRESLQIEIKALHARLGLTMIYVTHDQSEALAISDRVAVMNEGRLEQIGPPVELYEVPRSRFVADFIGEANFIPAHVEALHGEMLTLRAADGSVLTAPAALGCVPGIAAEVMIRPERIRIVEADRGRANLMTGHVEDSSYIGNSTRLQVRVRQDLVISVRHQNQRRLRLQVPVGTTVALGWDAEDAMVFASAGRERRA
jgi:putative spermidine/putrescine transport system ATP-binding protein